MFFLMRMKSQQKRKKIEQYTHRYLKLIMDIEKRCINHWHTLCNLPASDNAVYICGWQDITETRDLINALEVEKNKAIKATVAKSQFLATMSHEIRTPISLLWASWNFCRVLVLAMSNGWRRFHLPTPPDNHSSLNW